LFVFADLPFALFFVAIIAWIAGPLALIPLALLPVSLIVGLMFTRPVARLTVQNAAESTLKNGLLIESIDGAETLKSLAGESLFRQRWNDLTRQMSASELETKSLTGLSSHLSQAIQQISYVALVCAGVYAINAGELTMGGLIACSIISGRALTPFAQIAAVLVQWQHARAALLGLEPIVQLPADDQVAEQLLVRPQSCRGEIRLESVRYAYDEALEVLSIDALRFRPGERVAVIGQIGSGKSTLLKLLSGLYRPGSGRVFLDDVDMAHLDKAYLRQHIQYLPQHARLFNGTLRENLLLGAVDPGDDIILQAAQATGLDQFIAQHPRGLGLVLSEGGQGLSGGQRQLVTLTRLLLRPASVLLLDEPTAAIDGPLEERVMQSVLDRDSAATLIMVTHKASLLKLATRIIVMDRGRVFMDGPRDAVLQALMERQARPETTQASMAGKQA
jgi:ATP-binding cassette subfamily C protein LapB